MDIQKIILNNKKDRYLLELEYTEDEDIKKEIQNIINNLDKPLENKIVKFDNKIDEFEILSMKKNFYRLKKPQKIKLLNNYFKSKNVPEININNLSDNILELISNDTLKNKDIIYDIDNIEIKNINKIEIVDNNIKYIKLKNK